LLDSLLQEILNCVSTRMAVETHFYNLLEITPSATEDEILKSYRNLARIYHPDRNPDGVERFQEIVEAYKVLSDPEQRKIYDEKGELGLRVQKSTDSGCCQVYEDPNSGQLRSFCFGSMCGTFHSHGDDSDEEDYTDSDEEDEDDSEYEEGEIPPQYAHLLRQQQINAQRAQQQQHGHQHDHGHGHAHAHPHDHQHGHTHAHDHTHPPHGHQHQHDHSHQHVHAHQHDNQKSHEHAHKNGHQHDDSESKKTDEPVQSQSLKRKLEHIHIPAGLTIVEKKVKQSE